MQPKRQWSADATGLVIAVQAAPATTRPAPPAAANDAAPLPPPAAEPGRPDLLGAITKAASWLAREVIFAFSVYGAAAHPYMLDPAWNPDEQDPAERKAGSGFGSSASKVTIHSPGGDVII
jgi:hypothetical protein